MRKYFQNRQRELYNAYQASTSLGHSVPKGNERELIASQFLTQHMPPVIQPTQGVLIDQDTLDFAELNQTNCPQLDLLLVNSALPQLTLFGGSNIFFAESVAAVIEVKTSLSFAELSRILQHCKKVKERKRQVFGMYWANTDDPTSGPSDRVPYYVVSFESSKTGQEIMTFYQEKGTELEMTEEDQREFYPDGIFILNPDSGTIVLKGIGLHRIKTNLVMPPFYGGEARSDSLGALWLTLIAQVDVIRLMNFPIKTYGDRLFPKPQSQGQCLDGSR